LNKEAIDKIRCYEKIISDYKKQIFVKNEESNPEQIKENENLKLLIK
jgi:hypothetical protein